MNSIIYLYADLVEANLKGDTRYKSLNDVPAKYKNDVIAILKEKNVEIPEEVK